MQEIALDGRFIRLCRRGQPKEKKEPKELPEIQLPKEPPKPKIPADLSHPAVTYAASNILRQHKSVDFGKS